MSRAGAGTETRKLTYLHLSDNGCLSNDVLDEQQSQEVPHSVSVSRTSSPSSATPQVHDRGISHQRQSKRRQLILHIGMIYTEGTETLQFTTPYSVMSQFIKALRRRIHDQADQLKL